MDCLKLRDKISLTLSLKTKVFNRKSPSVPDFYGILSIDKAHIVAEFLRR